MKTHLLLYFLVIYFYHFLNHKRILNIALNFVLIF